jgi:hypothetical protein
VPFLWRSANRATRALVLIELAKVLCVYICVYIMYMCVVVYYGEADFGFK